MTTSIPAGSIAAKLDDIRVRMARAARIAGRDPGSVNLVAISKTQGVEAIREAIGAGQLVFGENRVQEAKAKFPALKGEFAGLRLHLVGPLQSNKVRDAVELFDVIHTLDRVSLAEALVGELARHGRLPELLIQVNTGEEPQKAGIHPAEFPAFLERCRTEYRLPIAGLMCIPPVEDDPSPHFAFLLQLARHAGLSKLSMGMSSDFEPAISLGATYVRIGSAIFGERDRAA